MTAPLPRSGDQRAAVVAGFLGWTLDAFDFFLVVMTLTAIAKEFGRSDAAIAFSLLLTLAFRPLGAFVFGLLADRYGRKLPLMLDLVFYSVVEVLSGLAPNYATFLVLRALFGIGMGAEWGVGASLVMEKVSPRARGVVSGLLQQGYAAGYLLAALCYLFVFPRWGWRPLFFLGGLPALLALFVRARVEESAVWRVTHHETWRGLGGAIRANLGRFLAITLLMWMMNMVSHGTQDMYPTFLERYWGFAPARRVALVAFSMVGALLGGTVFGFYSNRLGRRRTIVAALLGALLAVPLWAFAPSLALLVAGAFVMQFFVQGAWGVIPAHITELSPDAVRGFLPGFAYQCGVALAGAIGWLEARLAEHLSYAWAMALSAATVFVLGALVAALGPERRGQVFGGGAR
ncbi:MAG TPA: MFS transporter [Gemmatimonadales bacterium]|nr:MFS transporter [Gemmatimonadales bacterium]